MKKIIFVFLILGSSLNALAESEEASTGIGPDKGVLEANKEAGFKLSESAIKNFEIKNAKIESTSPWSLPLSATLVSGEEVNLYRFRNGFFKRIDFQILSRSNGSMKVTSSDLKMGDEVVVSGIGFLRAVELTVFSGNAEGHGH